jgi:hypothetical protein
MAAPLVSDAPWAVVEPAFALTPTAIAQGRTTPTA